MRITKTILALLAVAISHCAAAQEVPGAPSAAMAGCGVLQTDLWSSWHNQAGLTKVKSIQAGAYYQSRFATKELADKGFGVAAPLGFGTIGLNYRSFGYSAFSTGKAGLTYAIPFSENFSAGVQLNYHTIRITEGYGTQSTVSVEGGFRYQLNTRLSMAAHIANPTRSKLADFNDERLPSALRFGLGYTFGKKVLLQTEVRMLSDQDPQVRAAVEYNVSDQFILRAGAGSQPTLTAFGFGWKFKSFRADVAASYHTTLGFSPQISLLYTAPEK